GTARVASTLKANPGQWAPSPSFSYQWLRNGAVISGATSANYKPAAADIKAQLSVRVTATAPGYEKTSSTSFATVPIAAQTFTTAPTPSISGTARSGSTLTAKTAAWAPAPTLKYQWLRGGTAISGATKSTYKLTKADRSRTITVKVTATKSGFTTASRTSAGVKVQAGVDAQMAYLHKHWNNYNTAQWGNLNSIGGDCANFVSQGLIARGWEMTPEWYSRNQSRDRSSSWGYVPAMDAWLSKNTKKYGVTRLTSAERTKLKVGDIGMFDWNNNGVPDHTMTVSKVTTVNGKRKVYFISHNMDNEFRDLDYVSPSWPNTKVWFWSLPAE
ncbi:MAG: amidase domain-containing protein, partial [Mycetocola sp.]